uniref:CS domain-containing protein n=1 Tax=Ciona savignyi TaxID=51511 RepID=H2YA36_CIOSA
MEMQEARGQQPQCGLSVPSFVYLTFKVESCKNPDVKFESNKVCFTGEDGSQKVLFKNEFEFYDEIKPEESTWNKKGMGIECTIAKKLNETWPRLTKDKAKVHWLKVDFTKWKDEDDSEDDDSAPPSGGEPDFSQMMAQMGGGMPGMPGMGGMGGDMPDMDDLPEVDSDDEDIPELEEAEEKAEA